MVYEIYLRRGKETVHAYRWKGSPDIERTNRLFQEMIEEPLYSSAHKPWDTVAIFHRNSTIGRSFPRLKKPVEPERWFT